MHPVLVCLVPAQHAPDCTHANLPALPHIDCLCACPSCLLTELGSGKMYVAGNDSEGRAILVTRKKSDGFDGNFDQYVVSSDAL